MEELFGKMALWMCDCLFCKDTSFENFILSSLSLSFSVATLSHRGEPYIKQAKSRGKRIDFRVVGKQPTEVESLTREQEEHVLSLAKAVQPPLIAEQAAV
jgi:hypothetical protein